MTTMWNFPWVKYSTASWKNHCLTVRQESEEKTGKKKIRPNLLKILFMSIQATLKKKIFFAKNIFFSQGGTKSKF